MTTELFSFTIKTEGPRSNKDVALLAVMVLVGILGLYTFVNTIRGPAGSKVLVHNATDKEARVFVSFGASSVVRASNWRFFCKGSDDSSCSFSLASRSHRNLPIGNKRLNATFSVNVPVGCGATKAEVDLNNSAWYDIADVSLVDGYNNKLSIDVVTVSDGGQSVTKALGPPVGKDGNQEVFGLFPYGCDICVARQSPPCGIAKGTEGCKQGTQYDPKVPCQYQGSRKGGGGAEYKIVFHGS
jgi:hypothetical protein